MASCPSAWPRRSIRYRPTRRLKGRPKRFDVPLRDVRFPPGPASWWCLTGDIMTMPGLPKVPAAESIDIDEKGEVVGLF